MFGVAVIVMVSSRRDSYAIAGRSPRSGARPGHRRPVLGRLIDKHGQRRIALPAILLTSVALFTTCLSAVGAPLWTLFVAYAVSALLPEVGPMSRARWAHIMRDDPKGHARLLPSSRWSRSSRSSSGPCFRRAGRDHHRARGGPGPRQILFAGEPSSSLAARSTEPPVVPHDDRPRAGVNRPGMVIVPLVLFMVGVLFGANEVVAVAVSDEQAAGLQFDDPGDLRPGLGDLGIVVGTRDFTTSVIKRFVLLAAAMCVLQAPVLLTDNLWALVGIMFVAGSATAPMLITSLGLVQRLVPHALVTEGMAVAVTGVLIGISAGTAVGGWLVGGLGAHRHTCCPYKPPLRRSSPIWGGVACDRVSRGDVGA